MVPIIFIFLHHCVQIVKLAVLSQVLLRVPHKNYLVFGFKFSVVNFMIPCVRYIYLNDRNYWGWGWMLTLLVTGKDVPPLKMVKPHTFQLLGNIFRDIYPYSQELCLDLGIGSFNNERGAKIIYEDAKNEGSLIERHDVIINLEYIIQ